LSGARGTQSGTSYLSWLRVPLELIDFPPLSDRLTVHGVLEPFDQRFKAPKAFLDDLKTLRYRRVLSAGIGRDARCLSARAELNHHPFKHPW
jgi:hypothetical protein